MRYIWAFTLPIFAATLLFYATLDMRQAAHRLSREFINLALSPDGAERTDALARTLDGPPPVFDFIEAAAIGTMLFVAAIVALSVPVHYSTKRKLNLISAMVAGYFAANFSVGFGFLVWWSFGKWMLACLIVATSLIWISTAIKLRRNEIPKDFL